jgi:hypothetical protein
MQADVWAVMNQLQISFSFERDLSMFMHSTVDDEREAQDFA